MRLRRLFATGLLLLLQATVALPAQESIVVASTTSTQDSGLFGYLLPIVREQAGVDARVVALGTGQALDTARRGDADVLLVHDPAAEAVFVAQGHGLARREVMYNDFVLIGPGANPAQVRPGSDILAALQAIRAAQATFISRGDNSGTHQAELRLWQAAGGAVGAQAAWYRAVGQGMGPALNMAAASEAYILADRATWLTFRNKGALRILVEGDPRLFNQYSVIVVNPALHPAVKLAAARRFADFLLSPAGQAAIAGYRVDGQQLFHPNAHQP